MARDGRLFDPDPPRSRRIGRVRRGWDTTVKGMREVGRLEPVDEALVALGRVVADQADQCDRDADLSPFVRNQLYKTMLATITALYGQTGTDADLPSLDDLLAGMVDTAHEPAD